MNLKQIHLIGTPITRLACAIFTVFTLAGCVAAVPVLVGAASVHYFNDPSSSSAQLTRGQLSTIRSEESPVDPVISKLQAREDIPLAKLFEDETSGADESLYRLERGRIAQISGAFSDSMKEFEEVIATTQEQNEEAKVRISEIGTQVGATLWNDKVIPYRPAGYERVMMYHLQAMNFLLQGNIDSAAVEVRRANQEQVEALNLHEAEVEAARESARTKGLNLSEYSEDTAPVLAMMAESAGRVKNSFQNGYTFYVSGVIRELNGELDGAYIDYKKALEIFPNNRYIASDVTRLAKANAMEDDLKDLKKRFPNSFKNLPSAQRSNKKESEVIVLFEDDLLPVRGAIDIPLPIPGLGLKPISYPVYPASVKSPQPLDLLVSGAKVGTTEVACHVDALAARSLYEVSDEIVTRQILRTLVKGGSGAAARKGGTWAALGFNAYNQLSAGEDTRAWRTLPQNAQILRSTVAPGQLSLSLNHPKAVKATNIDLELPAGRTVVIRVIRIGSALYANHVLL